jgi:predicted porin
MKKTLIAVAALTCAAGAQAQSNVTLYGVLDHAVGYTTKVSGQNGNDGRQFAMYPAGGLEGSRWGLKGSEDLGAGLSAFFHLESGLNLGNGRFAEDNTMFNRRAVVGLRSREFGAVSLGRQSDMVADFVAPFSQVARYARTIGGAPYDLNNFDYTNQLQNSIKYVSPLFNGFHLGAAISIHGVAGANRDNFVWSIGGGYDNGPFKFGLAYTDSKNANFNPFLANMRNDNTRNRLVSSVLGRPALSTLSDAGSRSRIGALGGSYTFGPANIAATYSFVRNEIGGAFSGNGLAGTESLNVKAHIAEINGTYQLTSTVGLGLGYTFTRANVDARGASLQGRGPQTLQFHQLTAGANYALSRRTEVYFTVAAQRSGKGATGTFINGVGPSTSKTQVSTRVGLRHTF